jgi:S1-C subfamily serine protease
LKGTEGALVESVSPDTPAEKAGIKHGDIILEFNGQKIKDADDLRNKVAQAAPGTKAEVKLLRNGQERTVEVELALRPDPPSAGQPQEELSRDNPLSGIDVEDLTPELSRRLSLPLNVDGVVIMDVDPGSSAAEEGLRPGDVIQEIDRRPIRNVADFRQAAARAAGKDVLLFIYNHQARTTQYVVLKPRK